MQTHNCLNQFHYLDIGNSGKANSHHHGQLRLGPNFFGRSDTTKLVQPDDFITAVPGGALSDVLY